MLSLKIGSDSEGIIDSALSFTYFRIDSRQVRSRDITGKDCNENTNGPTGKQGSKFVVDNDISTKFFYPDYNDNFWIQFKIDEPVAVDANVLPSSNVRPD